MALSQEQKQLIQTGYSQWLDKNKYKPRKSQREMIAIIARTLADIEFDNEGLRSSIYKNHICLLEAGTGTGKTIAYAIPAIIMAVELNKTLVISTATVTLQEQLINNDLPNLLKQSGLEFTYALAKGRQRYLCLSKLTLHLADVDQSKSKTTLFPDEETALNKGAVASLEEISKAYSEPGWNGDRDSLPHEIPQDIWRLVSADRATCSGKKCAHYHHCALFNARDEVRSASVIVANHDLVLADLAAGGGNILPAPEEAIFVFDEAHHLPEKSRNHLSHSMTLSAERTNIRQSRKLFSRALNVNDLPSEIKALNKHMAQLDEASLQTLDNLQFMLTDLIDKSDQTNQNEELRFLNGVVPSEVQEGFLELSECLALKQNCFQKIVDALSVKLSDDDASGEIWHALYAEFGYLLAHTESALAVCQSYAKPDPANQAPKARWINRSVTTEGDTLQINSVPLSSAEILTQILWRRCYAAILTSATLAPLGDFKHFINKIGYGNNACAHKIIAGLNFSSAVFHVPAMKSSAGNAAEHTEEIIKCLPSLVAKNAGTLVLFSSRSQMELVFTALKSAFDNQILVQGYSSKQVLIEKHKQKVDEGETSIIFGLSSFAEGLDLPGDYCLQVVIAKLPFSVPDGPVDLAMRDWVESEGGNAFKDISLPEVSVRLMQACGRLLRKEQDTGRVTLLDSRIVTKYYGKQLIASLPPFQMELNK